MNKFKVISTSALSCLLCSQALAAKPVFQAPFGCGQEWRAWTYEGHNSNAIDLSQITPSENVVGEFEPVIASAPGEVVFDYTWPEDTSKSGERWIIVDHKDGWRTHYFHLENEEGQPRLTVGRKVAMGEVLGRNSDSGPTNLVHIHYAQMNNASFDAADLEQLAENGLWGTVLSDGSKKRVNFNNSAIDTYYDNLDSWGYANNEAEQIFSLNCTAGRFVHWYDNGDSMMMRYNPATGNARINEIDPTGGNNPLRHSVTWGRNWNTLVPFYSSVNSQAHVFRYDFADGDTDFFRVSPGGTGLTHTGSVKKYAGWTEIVPFHLNGKPHAVFYDSRYGWFNIDEINVTGSGFISRLKTKVKKGYTQLIPYKDGPSNYLIMYRAATGKFMIDRLNQGNAIDRTNVWSKKLKANWTHLALMQHLGGQYLFGYNSVNGKAKIWQIKNNGDGLQGIKNLNWQPGWTAITPYLDGSKAHLLLYRASDGLSRKIKMKNDATGFKHQITETWLDGYR